MFSRHVFRTSSRHVFKICLQDMSSRRLQEMSLRCLEDVFSITIFRLPRRLQEIFKTFPRRLGRQKIVTLMKTPSRHVLKASSRCLEDQQMFVGNSLSYVIKYLQYLLVKFQAAIYKNLLLAKFSKPITLCIINRFTCTTKSLLFSRESS